MIKIAVGVSVSVAVIVITAILVWWFVYRKKPNAKKVEKAYVKQFQQSGSELAALQAPLQEALQVPLQAPNTISTCISNLPARTVAKAYALPKGAEMSDEKHENVTKLFDGDYSTKYYTGSPCFLVSAINTDANRECGIIMKFDNKFLLNKFTLTTANDEEARDPKSIKIFGTNSDEEGEGVYEINDNDWSLLYKNEDLKLTSVRNASTVFCNLDIPKNKEYNFYKFIITEVKGVEDKHEGWQLSEIKFE